RTEQGWEGRRRPTASLVLDLIKLGDHLSEREDADLYRIGITGESLGDNQELS
ncbi:Os12g0545600, partial [Oryza sativa Japonica Group]